MESKTTRVEQTSKWDRRKSLGIRLNPSDPIIHRNQQLYDAARLPLNLFPRWVDIELINPCFRPEIVPPGWDRLLHYPHTTPYSDSVEVNGQKFYLVHNPYTDAIHVNTNTPSKEDSTCATLTSSGEITDYDKQRLDPRDILQELGQIVGTIQEETIKRYIRFTGQASAIIIFSRLINALKAQHPNTGDDDDLDPYVHQPEMNNNNTGFTFQMNFFTTGLPDYLLPDSPYRINYDGVILGRRFPGLWWGDYNNYVRQNQEDYDRVNRLNRSYFDEEMSLAEHLALLVKRWGQYFPEDLLARILEMNKFARLQTIPLDPIGVGSSAIELQTDIKQGRQENPQIIEEFSQLRHRIDL